MRNYSKLAFDIETQNEHRNKKKINVNIVKMNVKHVDKGMEQFDDEDYVDVNGDDIPNKFTTNLLEIDFDK